MTEHSITIEQASPMLPNVYFVRHGQTTANVSGILDRNPQLTALGATQALEAGVALSNIQPVAVIHTGLDRTIETASLLQLIGGFSCPFIEMDEFKEREMGIYDGAGAVERLRGKQGMEDLFQQYGPSFVWFAESTEEDHVEPLMVMRQRILQGLQKIQEQFGDQPVIIVAHEGSIKMAQLIYEQVVNDIPRVLATRRIANCEVRNFSER